MGKRIIEIKPDTLKGPRAYFTDIDPRDEDYDEKYVKLKLKLQLLTKDKIIVAASSLFHDIGYELFSKDKGLMIALEDGIIVPAIRDQYVGPEDFFEKKKGEYSGRAKTFFIANVKYSIPWNLDENTSWFKNTFYSHLQDDNSLLRKKISFTTQMSIEFISSLENEISKSEGEYKFLQREHIDRIGKRYGRDIHSYLNNYSNLIYRISGSKVVNAEGHFPQSNLTKLGVAGGDEIVSYDKIFWDIYVEAIISYLNSALRLTPDRLDQLSVLDILKLRNALLDIDFSTEYDQLISKAKSDIEIDNPEKLILKQGEITAAAASLRNEFRDRVDAELHVKDSSDSENALWQVANLISLVSLPEIGFLIGSLSALKSIPEITAPVSKSLTNSIISRFKWAREFINSRIGWSKEQKKSLVEGYKQILLYGMPE